MSDKRLLADLSRALNRGIVASGLFARTAKPKRRRESKTKIVPPVVGQKQLF
jgi:hypothetical protein